MLLTFGKNCSASFNFVNFRSSTWGCLESLPSLSDFWGYYYDNMSPNDFRFLTKQASNRAVRSASSISFKARNSERDRHFPRIFLMFDFSLPFMCFLFSEPELWVNSNKKANQHKNVTLHGEDISKILYQLFHFPLSDVEIFYYPSYCAETQVYW